VGNEVARYKKRQWRVLKLDGAAHLGRMEGMKLKSVKGTQRHNFDVAYVQKLLEGHKMDENDARRILGEALHVIDRLDFELNQLNAGLQELSLTSQERGKYRKSFHLAATKHQQRVNAYAAALQLIASPIRPDGTYNRDRDACRI
jgi:hypothetical protein